MFKHQKPNWPVWFSLHLDVWRHFAAMTIEQQLRAHLAVHPINERLRRPAAP